MHEHINPKKEDTIRIVFQNVNGISIKNNLLEAYAASYMHEMEAADILGIAETNTNFNRNDLRQISKQVYETFGQSPKA